MNRQAEPFQTPAAVTPQVGVDREHESAHLHVAGQANYIDDLRELDGTLHAALGLSPVAHGRLLAIDVARLRAEPGIVAVFTADDIPGPNDCAPIVKGDDPIRPVAADLAGRPADGLLVVTADRGLRARLPAAARVAGPGWLLAAADATTGAG